MEFSQNKNKKNGFKKSDTHPPTRTRKYIYKKQKFQKSRQSDLIHIPFCDSVWRQKHLLKKHIFSTFLIGRFDKRILIQSYTTPTFRHCTICFYFAKKSNIQFINCFRKKTLFNKTKNIEKGQNLILVYFFKLLL